MWTGRSRTMRTGRGAEMEWTLNQPAHGPIHVVPDSPVPVRCFGLARRLGRRLVTTDCSGREGLVAPTFSDGHSVGRFVHALHP